MKPLELTISAIGPFAEQTEISFERLGKQGFFSSAATQVQGKPRSLMPSALRCSVRRAARTVAWTACGAILRSRRPKALCR